MRGIMHLIVSNFSKKKNVSLVPVTPRSLWVTEVWSEEESDLTVHPSVGLAGL